jgi:hypothetical protein
MLFMTSGERWETQEDSYLAEAVIGSSDNITAIGRPLPLLLDTMTIEGRRKEAQGRR